MPFIKEL